MFELKSNTTSLEQFERYDGMGPLNLLIVKLRNSRLGQENSEFDGRLPYRELFASRCCCREDMLKRLWGIVPVI
jgi:hypothetical protein